MNLVASWHLLRKEGLTVPLLAGEVIEVGAQHDGYYESD